MERREAWGTLMGLVGREDVGLEDGEGSRSSRQHESLWPPKYNSHTQSHTHPRTLPILSPRSLTPFPQKQPRSDARTEEGREQPQTHQTNPPQTKVGSNAESDASTASLIPRYSKAYLSSPRSLIPATQYISPHIQSHPSIFP